MLCRKPSSRRGSSAARCAITAPTTARVALRMRLPRALRMYDIKLYGSLPPEPLGRTPASAKELLAALNTLAPLDRALILEAMYWAGWITPHWRAF